MAASSADVYLTWGEPPAQVAEKLAWIRQLAAAQGRALRFGIRLHVITRDTEADAWAEASRLLDYIDPAEIARAQQVLGASESVGQDRMRALHAAYRHGGSAQDLEIYPNLWAGVGLVRGGAGTALVGSHEKVADLIEEYASLGISEFILSGYPHLEEAYWFGEGVLPEIRGARRPPASPGAPTCRPVHDVPRKAAHDCDRPLQEVVVSFVVLAANPRPQSRTLQIARLAADAVSRAAALTGEHQVIDLSVLARRLLLDEPSPAVEDALDQVRQAGLLLVASPTYKGTYTGLLKVFLDRLDYQALSSVIALPLLVMRVPNHALAVDLHLRPLLLELGASTPAPGLAFLEPDLAEPGPVLEAWAARVAAALGRCAALATNEVPV